eukprot:8182266-Pyramimonas_sp.AAC.1
MTGTSPKVFFSARTPISGAHARVRGPASSAGNGRGAAAGNIDNSSMTCAPSGENTGSSCLSWSSVMRKFTVRRLSVVDFLWAAWVVLP